MRLEDDSYNVRKAAAVAIGQLGPWAAEAGPALEAALANPGFAARTQAAVALSQTTGNNKLAVAVLIEELQTMTACGEAAEAFSQLGDGAQVAVPLLTELLRNDSAETRMFAALALGGIGRFAQESLPELRRLLDDNDEAVRVAAAQAIADIENQ